MYSINKKAHEWLHREIKITRQAQTHAEERHAKLGDEAGCLECELRNIRQKLDVLDYMAGLVERDMEEENGENVTPTTSCYDFLTKRFNMPERGVER